MSRKSRYLNFFKSNHTALKAVALALSFVIFASVFSFAFSVRAVSPMEYTVSKVSGKAGDTVEVSVSISPNSEVGAMRFDLSYDKTKLQYKKNEYSKTTGAMITVNPDYIAGFRLVLVHADGLSFGGSLLTLEFEILAGWSGMTDLKLSVEENYHYKSYNAVPFTVKNGSVSVSGGTGYTTTTERPTTTKPTTTKPTTTKSVTTTKPTATVKPVTTTKQDSKNETEKQTTNWVTVPDWIIDQVLSPTTKPSKPETSKQDTSNEKSTVSSPSSSSDGTGQITPERTGLSDEEKELVLEHFSKESIPVSIGDDGSIYIQDTTEPLTGSEPAGDELSDTAVDESEKDSVGKSPSKIKIVFALILAILSIFASFFAIVINLKKRRK